MIQQDVLHLTDVLAFRPLDVLTQQARGPESGVEFVRCDGLLA